MSKRRRTYTNGESGNNIGVEADFSITIQKGTSSPSSMISVDGDPSPLLNAFRRCLCKKKANNQVSICFLNDSNSGQYYDGSTSILTGSEGDVMVYFPEFWYKGEDTSNSWKIYISTTQVNKDNYEEQGWHYAPASLVGAYKAYVTGNKVYSRSGVERTTDVSMANFSTYARNRGAGYHLIDYQQHCIIAWMFYAKYKNTNSQAICGTGDGTSSGIDNGTTNSLGMTDTTPSNAGSSSNKLVNFLGIEGCWGYVYEWIEGIHSQSSDGVIAYDKGDFHDQRYSAVTSQTKRILRTPGEESDSGYISKIEGGVYMDMVGAEYNGSSSSYFCDYGYVNPSYTYVFRRSYDYARTYGGVAYLRGNGYSSYGYSDIGSRLAFDGNIEIIDDVSAFKSLPVN